jgi:hypothetical protein
MRRLSTSSHVARSRCRTVLTLAALTTAACQGRASVASTASIPSVSSAPASDAITDLAIRDVSVVDVQDGSVRAGQTVLVSGDRIVAVRDAASLATRAARRTIAGAGLYVMPGLWDMHVHLRANGTPAWITTDWLLPLTFAFGVTGVRDMNGDCEEPAQGPVCLADLQRLRREIDAGTQVGPRILAISSFPIDPPFDYAMTLPQAKGAMEALAERGVDLVKIYNRLTPDGLRMIAEEARRVNLPIAGHVPLRVTAIQASDAGFRSIEHARDFLFDCFPGSADFRRTTRSVEPPLAVRRAMVDQHDSVACATTYATLVRNQTWYVPTHVTRRMDAFAADSAFRSDPRSRYVPKLVWDDWNRDADRMIGQDTTAGRVVMRAFYEKGLALTGAAYRAGVRVVLGTDAGDSYVFPGSAVHDELAELVSAGLTPAQALRAATFDAAEFLGATTDYGSVTVGRRADLLLLRANPLVDIRNSRQLEAVIFRGVVSDRARLDSMLLSVEAAVQRPISP